MENGKWEMGSGKWKMGAGKWEKWPDTGRQRRENAELREQQVLVGIGSRTTTTGAVASREKQRSYGTGLRGTVE